MRLLHVSSLLFNKPWFRWVACEGPAFDAVVLAGNLLNPASGVSREDQQKWIGKWASEFRGRLLIVSGPNDVLPLTMRADWLQLLASPKVYVEGRTMALGEWRLEPVSLWGLPDGDGPRHVFLRSAPPAGELVGVHRQSLVDDGCRLLAARLRHTRHRSYAGLFGFVPQPCDWFGSAVGFPCFNPGVGRWNLPQPSFIVHDLEKGRSEWFPYGTYGGRASVQHLRPS